MCSNPASPYLVTENRENGVVYWMKADCKLWTCDECAERNKTRVAARAGVGVEDWQKIGLVVNLTTLTCHRKVRRFDDSIDRWREAWPRLRKRAARRSDEFHYALFPEQHKTGAVHVHLLETGNLGQRFWKDSAAAVGLGYQAKTRKVEGYADGARYATKYLTKSISVEDWPAKFHRFRFSQMWPDHNPETEPGQQWRVFFSDAELNDELRFFIHAGYKIVNMQTGDIHHE